MRLGEIIKKYRADHNMSMDDFSERSGISKSYISLLEKKSPPANRKTYHPINSIHQTSGVWNGNGF